MPVNQDLEFVPFVIQDNSSANRRRCNCYQCVVNAKSSLLDYIEENYNDAHPVVVLYLPRLRAAGYDHEVSLQLINEIGRMRRYLFEVGDYLRETYFWTNSVAEFGCALLP
jgi:hypothetical protein